MKVREILFTMYLAFISEYENEGWKIRGYSEFNSMGIPKFVELEKEN